MPGDAEEQPQNGGIDADKENGGEGNVERITIVPLPSPAAIKPGGEGQVGKRAARQQAEGEFFPRQTVIEIDKLAFDRAPDVAGDEKDDEQADGGEGLKHESLRGLSRFGAVKPLGGDEILDHAHDMLLLTAGQPGNFLEHAPGLADRSVATLGRLVMSEQVIDGNVQDGG